MMSGRGFFGNFGGRNVNTFGRLGFMHVGFFLLIAVIVLVLAAVLIFVLVHNKHKKVVTNQPANQSAYELLKLQYVKGEITEEEFVRRKNLLNQP